MSNTPTTYKITDKKIADNVCKALSLDEPQQQSVLNSANKFAQLVKQQFDELRISMFPHRGGEKLESIRRRARDEGKGNAHAYCIFERARHQGFGNAASALDLNVAAGLLRDEQPEFAQIIDTSISKFPRNIRDVVEGQFDEERLARSDAGVVSASTRKRREELKASKGPSTSTSSVRSQAQRLAADSIRERRGGSESDPDPVIMRVRNAKDGKVSKTGRVTHLHGL